LPPKKARKNEIFWGKSGTKGKDQMVVVVIFDRFVPSGKKKNTAEASPKFAHGISENDPTAYFPT